ncbi:MAG: major capsid family protein [Cyanobacteria bacterium P01_H01_bin.121]
MAPGGFLLGRALEQRLPRVIEKRYRSLHFENGDIVPTMSDLETGAAEVLADLVDGVGDAKIMAENAVDLPIADISASEDKYPIWMIGSAIAVSLSQEQAAEKSSQTFNQIVDRKLSMARRAIAERSNKIAAYGSVNLNQRGFVNNANVTVNNSSFDPYDAGTSPDALKEFFIDEFKAAHKASNNVEFPETVIVSDDLWFKLINTRMTDGSQSVYEHLMRQTQVNESLDFIRSIMMAPEVRSDNLTANGTGNTDKDRIVMYPMDPEVVERHNRPAMELAPDDYQQVKGVLKIRPVYQKVTPTIVNHPSAMRYIDVAKAS